MKTINKGVVPYGLHPEQLFCFQPGKSTLHYLYKLYHDVLARKSLPIATVYDLEILLIP